MSKHSRSPARPSMREATSSGQVASPVQHRRPRFGERTGGRLAPEAQRRRPSSCLRSRRLALGRRQLLGLSHRPPRGHRQVQTKVRVRYKLREGMSTASFRTQHLAEGRPRSRPRPRARARTRGRACCARTGRVCGCRFRARGRVAPAPAPNAARRFGGGPRRAMPGTAAQTVADGCESRTPRITRDHVDRPGKRRAIAACSSTAAPDSSRMWSVRSNHARVTACSHVSQKCSDVEHCAAECMSEKPCT